LNQCRLHQTKKHGDRDDAAARAARIKVLSHGPPPYLDPLRTED
jgi:hypothetical protein